MTNTQLFSSSSYDHTVLGEYFQPKKFFLDKQRQLCLKNLTASSVLKNIDAFPAIDMFMGLEVELENVKIEGNIKDHLYQNYIKSGHTTSHFFLCKEDGSLRNHGAEFVSKMGLKGQEILCGLHSLLVNSDTFLEQPDPSTRTSIHVHVSVLPYTIGQYKKMLFWYSCLEPLFFKLSGNRVESIFCVPWKVSESYLRELLCAETADNFTSYLQHCQKYSALNLLTTPQLGTVEFRHHVGTTDYHTIENWMIFLYQFMLSATGDKKETICDVFEKIMKALKNKNLDQLILDEFGIMITDIKYIENHIRDILLLYINAMNLLSKDMGDALPTKVKRGAKSSEAPLDALQLDSMDFLFAQSTTTITSNNF